MEEDKDFQSDENIENILNVNSFEDQNTMLQKNYNNSNEASSQYEFSQYPSNDEFVIVNDDDDYCQNSNSISDTNENFNVRKKLVASTPIKTTTLKIITTNEIDDDTEIEIFDQQVSNVNLSVNSGENKKPISISVIPMTAHMKPTNSISRLQPKSTFPEISYKKCFTKSNITSKNESKNELYVPHDDMKYELRNENSSELKNQSFISNTSVSSIVKANNTATESSLQKKKIILSTTKVVTSREISELVIRMQKLPNGMFKMIPTQEKEPVGLEKLLEQNYNIVTQKSTTSTANEHDVYNFIRVVKPLKSPYQMAKPNETGHFHQNRRVLSEKSQEVDISKSNDCGNASRNIKLISHTAISENAIQNHRNIIAGNDEMKIMTNRDINTSSGFIQLSANSESPVKSNSQPLSNTRYDSLEKPNTKLNTNNKEKSNLSTQIVHNNCDVENGFLTTTSSDEIYEEFPNKKRKSNDIKFNKNFEEHSNKNKVLLEKMYREKQNKFSEEGDNDKYGRFISCAYVYCDTLVHAPELIDYLYCSLTCKKLNLKNYVAVKESEETTKIQIDRTELLKKLENRIHKRKQLLTSSNPKKKFRNDDKNDFEELKNSFSEMPLNENQSSIDLYKTNSPEIKNDDDGGDDEKSIMSDFKSYIGNKNKLVYTEKMKFRSAPLKLFNKPFPLENNHFKVGHKLEGIDPKHESLFCVLTVTEICGYRIKLHFDGYPKEYDFWVNADNPDIFYPTWCEENSRIIQLPKDYDNVFNWPDYLKECNAFPALRHYFASTKNLANCKTHKFIIGAKLEALDKSTRTSTKQLICVATVADILGSRIRIHFDGWTDDFDYWTDITSINIHPIRWCEKNGRNLSPPNDFKGRKPFSWTKYLQETNSYPVPEDAFVRRPLRDFSIKMTIEVVDLVVPSLIRIAEVVDVRGDELKILYDGFHSNYAYWVEDDSPNIHPVGWSVKTNHPLELPAAKNKIWKCRVLGCNGKGNSNSLNNDHFDPNDCPYELDSWKKAVAELGKLPDRFKTFNVPIITTLPSVNSQNMKMHDDTNKIKFPLNTNVCDTLIKDHEKVIDNGLNEQLSMKKIRLESSTDFKRVLNIHNDNTSPKDTIKLRKYIGLSLLIHNVGSSPYSYESKLWTRNNDLIGIALCNDENVRKWSVAEVASYVRQIVSKSSNRTTENQISISDRFINEEIDGETFLMLNQEELLKLLKIPLGQALKILNAIIMLRQRISAFDKI